ncbi:MAG: hypothetical protein RBT34_13200 [Anaerolineaceae bacterium]|jgi:hypothetical protein|nr:hypothetical protein [Anaerolineaceae bacterium]
MTGSTKRKATGRKPHLSDARLAARLAGEAGVMAFRRLADGGMVMINGHGQKQMFSVEEVRSCTKEEADGTG